MIKNAIIAGLVLALIAVVGFVLIDGSGAKSQAESQPQLSQAEREEEYLERVRGRIPDWLSEIVDDDELLVMGEDSCSAMDALKREDNYRTTALTRGIAEAADTREIAETMIIVTVAASHTLCPEHSELMEAGL